VTTASLDQAERLAASPFPKVPILENFQATALPGVLQQDGAPDLGLGLRCGRVQRLLEAPEAHTSPPAPLSSRSASAAISPAG
jgi:hypothetical protein